MKKKSARFLMVLILSIGVITLGGCGKDSVESEDEENLGASRPIIGTVISYRFKVEDITFKNTKDETVWMKMTRKK